MKEQTTVTTSELKKTTYIVTKAHNQDYISATAYLTEATSPQEAIIACMEYDGCIAVDYDSDEEDHGYEAELTRLRSLSLYELEQDDRDNGNVWSAGKFTMPTLDSNNPVVQIAKLDTD